MPEKKRRIPACQIYTGDLGDAVRKLQKEILYQSGGKRSFSSELRPAIKALLRKYGIEGSE